MSNFENSNSEEWPYGDDPAQDMPNQDMGYDTTPLGMPFTDGDDDPYPAYDTGIMPDDGLQSWEEIDFTVADFVEAPAYCGMPGTFGVRQFDGIEPTPADITGNSHNYAQLHTKLLAAQDPVLSHTTDEGEIKITIDQQRGIMVDFYGADGSVSYNRYHGMEGGPVYVNRANRSAEHSNVPPPGAVSDIEHQEIISRIHVSYGLMQSLRGEADEMVSRQELEHITTIAEEASPAIASFYDMLQACENRAASDCSVSNDANRHAAQLLIDYIGNELEHIENRPDSQRSFVQKAVQDGPHKSMAIRCGYGPPTENDPTPARVSINLSERAPTGGRAEKRIILASTNGALLGAVIERLFAEHGRQPLRQEERYFTPDATHFRILRNLFQNPHIYNYPSNPNNE